MEDFGLDFEIDEATKARIAHTEFLNKVKEWGMQYASDVQPFSLLAQAVLSTDIVETNPELLRQTIAAGIDIILSKFNEFYDIVQQEAVNVLGGAFSIHKDHTVSCNGTSQSCPHQDHFSSNKE